MWLIAGLGNPGGQYAMNRHNIGFMALDSYCISIGEPRWKEEKKSLTTRMKIDGEEVLFAKPQTFMNRSGESLRALLDYYKISIENFVVIHDDLDQDFGAVKIHKNRGPGGHNGLKSINEQLGTQDYIRLKLGIGRPQNSRMNIADFVLQDFSTEETQYLHDYLAYAGDAIDSIVTIGLSKTATKFTRGGLEF